MEENNLGNSIFRFEQKAGVNSTMGNWSRMRQEDAEENAGKTLAIKFLSCTADDKKYYLKFEVTASGLANTVAKIYVGENEVFGTEEAVPLTTVTIANGKTAVTVSFSKDIKFSSGWFEGELEFIATIDCDGISAKTTEFALNCAKAISNNATDCIPVAVVPLALNNPQKAQFISTVMAETDLGSEYLRDIAWVYYNRVFKDGLEKGLKASNAFRNKNRNYKLCMYFLGFGKEYANFQYDGVPLSKYVKENGWFKNKVEPNFKKMKAFIEKEIFSPTPKTCFKGWRGQGYWADLDLNPEDPGSKGDSKWYIARQYYWLQLKGSVSIKYVQILKDGNSTSFIFDEDSIKEFFKNNPKLLPPAKDVKKFNNGGVLNFEL